ncbi:outer membrane protein assembly factor BamB family protein [Gimesia aquarii]|uniref:Outer membrane biogenesis protein BamB n=1 Tax=Gimesia aquarii TaxID=2527964 RepID=A0A517W0Z8_9PLAN|nr:PQQ-binding-like beta-propeller repeat protein [Gimesia aquarii]QDT98931.1 outer membrane biogenesis protein BamB [Gimesia aquarii]
MHSFNRILIIALIVSTCQAFPQMTHAQAADEKDEVFEHNKPNQQAKPLNELKKIIQGWFGQAKPARVQLASPATKSKNHAHYRFPQDLEQERRFKRAQQLIDDQQWEPAREKLQLMLENSLNLPVHVKGDRSLITDRELIYQLLELLPAEQREKFNRQYNALAEKLFTDAQLNQASPEIYAEIATRFATTASGFKAMNYLVSYHIDRGEFGLAEQYIQRLFKYRAPITESSQWRTKAAFVLKQTGKQSLIAELLNSGRDATQTDEAIEIAGSLQIPQEWLSKQVVLNLASNLLLDEWPMLLGSPNRSARAQNADPLLIPRWSSLITSNHSIQSQLKLIQEDLQSLNRATIPALPPLAINGKIVFRTLKGVQVLDAKTGTPLWESSLENSPEASYITSRLKGVNVPQARGLFDPVPENQALASYNGTNPDHHALTNLIFRNANWGSQSSDGQHLFIIENMRLNFQSSSYRSFNRFGRRNNSSQRTLWSSNQIVAYDLNSGQPVWKVGGTKFDEPFDLPLAGTFFFGAPTPAGNELYVVGERDREIRVYALDPQTGEERWSQQIGNPDQDIETDMVRRWWIAPIAVDQGVLICPTNIGLLTAIDRLNHSILWSTQYVNVPSNYSGNRFNRINQTAVETLGQRWCPSAPVISKNKVIYTPPDEKALICLDLITGVPSWTKRAKETSQYLAGVVDDQILLVGLNGVTSISLTNGKKIWNTTFQGSAGPPSGQSVIADKRLHVPLQSGQVWTFDVNSGKVIDKIYNAKDAQRLGNLIIYEGQFLSLSASGLVSYEQKQTFEAEIKQIKQQDSQSSLALYKESELLMMSHRYQDALAQLQQIDIQQLPAKLQNSFHHLIVNCLSSLIRSDFHKYDRLVDQLGQHVRSEKERIELKRLLIERFIARQQYAEAFDLILELANAPEETFFQTANTELRLDSWLASKALELWDQAGPSNREQITSKISLRAQQILGAELLQQERFLSQFGFHDAALPVLEQLIESSLQSDQFYEAELLLTRLMKHKSPHISAQALTRMVDLCLKFNLNQDAGYYLDQLAQYDQSLTISENKTIDQFLDQKQNRLNSNLKKNRQDPWQPQKLKLIVAGSDRSQSRYYSSRRVALNTKASSLPFYQSRTLAVSSKENRLIMSTPSNNRLIWSTPLRSSFGSRSSSLNESEIVGHNLILQHRDMLHFYNLVDQKLIWSKKLEKEQTNRYYSNSYTRLRPAHLANATTLLHQHHPSVAVRTIGMIAAANEDYTCYYNRRKIVLVDTRTGKVRWTHENFDQDTRVLGDDRLIYLVTRDRVTRKILRVSDGQPTDLKNINHSLRNAIYQNDSAFVAIEAESNGKKKEQISIYSFYSQSTEDLWNLDFPKDSLFGIFDYHHLSVLSPSGELFLVDLRTGKKSSLESILPADLKKYRNFYLTSDEKYIYFVTHSQSSNSISINAPSIPINGMLHVFDRQTGKKIWNQSFKKQHLVLNTQNLLPVILLVSRDYKRTGNRATSIVHLQAVDKQTGKNLLTWKAPLGSNIHTVAVDQQQKIIEILTHNARIRLYDADRLASGAPVAPALKQPPEKN